MQHPNGDYLPAHFLTGIRSVISDFRFFKLSQNVKPDPRFVFFHSTFHSYPCL